MMITVEILCPFCGATHYVTCDAEGFDAWQGGELIQNTSLAELSADEREQLISHLCPSCIAETFGSDEEDEDEDCDYVEPYDLDMGFDPYIGEYTYDC